MRSPGNIPGSDFSDDLWFRTEKCRRRRMLTCIRSIGRVWRENAGSFLVLPRDVFVLLLIEGLGTLGSRIGSAGRYQMMLNEYSMGEIEARYGDTFRSG